MALLLALLGPAQAEAAEITGQIDGIEVAPQGRSHGAIFVFNFAGQLDNGRTRKGFGWIEVVHETPLPTAGNSALILGGRGVLWIGLQRFEIDVMGGDLVAPSPFENAFGVTASLDVSPRRGGPVAHLFDGTLDHNPFPPTIGGSVTPE